MSVSVSRSLVHVEQGRSSCNVSCSLSVELFASQRVSVMYVCFGFSLARLRRTRTIDLQCQSLSLRRAFLLHSTCLSLHQTVASYGVRWLTHSQNQTKIFAKIDRKSIPETPQESQNRVKIARGTLSGHPVASKSVPKASRECLGSVPERPRRAAGASGGSARLPRDARNGTLERLGARRRDQNRRQVASGTEKIEFSSRFAFARHRRSDVSSIFVDFCFFRKVRNVCFVPRLPVGPSRCEFSRSPTATSK